MPEITKNVPPPAPYPKYPFRAMEVGDSFLVTSPAEYSAVRKAASCAQYSFGRQTRRYSCRICKEGLRVYRLPLQAD